MNNCFTRFCCPMCLLFGLSLLLFALPKCHHCAIIDQHHSPISASSSLSSSPTALSSEIRFMQKLFHRYERGNGIGSSAIGYTPTVSAKKCDVCGSSTALGWGLKFAVNKLAPTERYVHAELHLHGRLDTFLDAKKPTTPLHIVQFVCSCDGRAQQKIGKKTDKKSWEKWTTDRIWPSREIPIWLGRIGDDGMVDTTDNGQLHSPAPREWTVFDAMTPLLYASMDEDTKQDQQQLQLHINLYRYRIPLGEQQLRRFIHNHRPFLVVYTEEMLSATKNGGSMDKNKLAQQQQRRAKRDIRATLTDYGDIPHHMDTVRKTAEYFSYGMAKGNVDDVIGAQVPLENAVDGNAFDTLRRLSRRRKMRSRKSKHKQKYPGFDPNDPMLGFGTPFSPWQRIDQRTKLLQSPSAGTSLNDIRRLREHGYWTDGNDTTNANDETKLFIIDEHTQKSDAHSAIQRCSWHNLTVDFHELGWSDRIIAPKSFEAGFCGGHCDYPLENESNPSNHAILQSLIATQRRRQQQQREVRAVPATQQQPLAPPAVCCAPEKFDSLTLLYFDERDNVVLKNYPRMVVLSCGCI